MPVPMLKSFSKKTGLSLDQLEKYWDEAKDIAKEKGQADDWPLIVSIVKNKAGIKEYIDIAPECEFYLEMLYEDEFIDEGLTPAQRLKRSIISRTVAKRTSKRAQIKRKRKKSLQDLTKIADKKARNKLKMKLAKVKTMKDYNSLPFNRKNQVEKMATSYKGRVKRIARKELFKLIKKYSEMTPDNTKSEYTYKKFFKINVLKNGEIKLYRKDPEKLIKAGYDNVVDAGKHADALLKEFGEEINNTDIRTIKKHLKELDGGPKANSGK